MTEPETLWPTALRIDSGRRSLHITFDNGETFELTAELLRVESPSAEVQGHGGPKQLVAGRRMVAIIGAEPGRRRPQPRAVNLHSGWPRNRRGPD